MSVARSVWMALLQDAVAAVRPGEDGADPELPEKEWQAEVLRRLLPEIDPRQGMEELLRNAATAWRDPGGSAAFLSQAEAVIGEFVGADKSLRLSLRKLNREGPFPMAKLKLLDLAARRLLTESFLRDEVGRVDVGDFERDAKPLLGRDVTLEPLSNVLDEAMSRFLTRPDESDGWLAPRIHACLRLTRREAAAREIWAYLNIAFRPDYVRWRFISRKGPSAGTTAVDRFLGEDSRNAIGRLWWAAELTRNGGDYGLTQAVSSRFFISWQALDVMHHRPAAVAVARFLSEGFDGEPLPDVASQRLAKAFNLCLSTVCVDAMSENPAVDAKAIRGWCEEPFDESKYLGDALPEGPPEETVSEDRIEPVYDLLNSLARQIGIFSKDPDIETESVAAAGS